jgi:hypothetical protein
MTDEDEILRQLEVGLLAAREETVFELLRRSPEGVWWGELTYYVAMKTGTAEVGKVDKRITELIREGRIRNEGARLYYGGQEATP